MALIPEKRILAHADLQQASELVVWQRVTLTELKEGQHVTELRKGQHFAVSELWKGHMGMSH